MSGSGSAVFGIFEDRGKAERVFRALRAGGAAGQIFLTAPVDPKKQYSSEI